MAYTKRLWLLVLCGPALAALLTAGLGELLPLLHAFVSQHPKPATVPYSFFLHLPWVLYTNAVWMTFPAGAATAYVLVLVHRAFEPQEEPRAHT